MTKRRNTNRQSRRKRGPRRRRARRSLGAHSVPVGVGIPDRVFAKLKYTDVIKVSPGALTSSYVFNLNSLYDPDRTGVGHQPMMFDEWSTLYNRYKVHGCSWKISVSFPNTQTATCVYPSNTSAASADITDAAERRYATIKQTAGASTSHNIVKFKGYAKMRKLYGRKELENKDEALISASPTEIACLHLFSSSMDGATNISSYYLVIELVYYAELFDRKDVVGS